VYDEKNYTCPLVERVLWDSECYDIQMVRSGFIKPDVLDFILNKPEAIKHCESCPFNQLKQKESEFRKTATA